MQTTLNKIRAYSPCRYGWEKLLRYLGKTEADDEPLSISTIIDSNSLDDAIWCLRAVNGHDREIRLYAVWCARQSQHLMLDQRSITALDVAEKYALGRASDAELAAVRVVANDAVSDVIKAATRAAPRDSTRAARVAAWAATEDVAITAVSGAAAAAAVAIDAPWDVAKDMAMGKKYVAMDAQAKELRRICDQVV